jgi:hypothetical protein
LVLAIGTTLVYLDVHGFPPFLVRIVQQQFARAGYSFRCSQMRLDWLRGVMATGVQLADAKTPDRPLAKMDEVVLQISLRRLWNHQNAISALQIANANLSVPTPPDEQGQQEFTATKAYAVMAFEDDGTIRIGQLIGTYCGISLRVRGSVKPTAASTAPPSATSAVKEPASGRFVFITKALRELYSLRAGETPQLDLDFDLDLAQPWATRANVRLFGRQIQYRKATVGLVAVRVAMADGAVQINECRLETADGTLSLTGRYDVAMGEFDFRLKSTVHPEVVAVVLPENLAQTMRQVKVGPAPQINARYWLAPDTGSLPKIEVGVEAGDLEYRGVKVRALSLLADSQGAEIFVRKARIEMAEGVLTGHGQYHLESSDFTYEFDSTLNPTKLLPLMPRGIRPIIEPSTFAASPHIVAKVTGDFVDPERFAYDADITTGECRYRNVPLTSAAAKVSLLRNRLKVRDLVVTRPEGALRGAVTVDFNRQNVRFDLQSTADPVALAPILGPQAAEFMKPYRFGKSLRGSAVGMFDFAQPTRSAWTAEFTNRDFRAWDLTAQQAHANLSLTNDTVHIVAEGRNLTGWNTTAAAGQVVADIHGRNAHVTGSANTVTWGTATAAVVRAAVTVEGNRGRIIGDAGSVTWASLYADTMQATVNVARASTQAEVTATGFGWWRLKTDKARADVVFTNRTLAINAFDSDIYAGKLRGEAGFNFTNSVAYRFQLDAANVDVDLLTQAMRNYGPGRTVTGNLDGHVELAGSGNLNTLTGKGNFRIGDGVLWEGAVFGFLSKVLGKTKATDAKGTFTVHDKAVWTEDLRVEAGALTAKSHGHITFAGDLDFRVQAQFLRSVPGLNLIGAVVGKMFEYQIAGNLDQPEYHPVNAPTPDRK